MTAALTRVLPLALGAMVSPMLLLLQAAALASRFHAVVRSLLVLAGNALVVAVVTVVIVVSDHRTEAGMATGGGEVVGAWIRIVLAVFLAVTAVRLALGDRSGDQVTPDAGTATDPGVRPGRYLLFGIAAMATNATSLVLFIPAVHTTVTAGLDRVGEVAVLGVLWLFILAPSFAPLLVYAALGNRGPAVLDRFGRWLRTHNRTIGIVVAAGFAVYLGVSGFVSLA